MSFENSPHLKVTFFSFDRLHQVVLGTIYDYIQPPVFTTSPRFVHRAPHQNPEPLLLEGTPPIYHADSRIYSNVK